MHGYLSFHVRASQENLSLIIRIIHGVRDLPSHSLHRFSGQSGINQQPQAPYFRVQVAELINRPDQFSFQVAAMRANEHRERIGAY